MKKLPVFKTEEEEARFWDTHSPLDFHSKFSEVKDPFEFAPSLLKKVAGRREERKRQLTLRMEKEKGTPTEQKIVAEGEKQYLKGKGINWKKVRRGKGDAPPKGQVR